MRRWSFSGVHKLSGNRQLCFEKLTLVPTALWKAGNRQRLMNKAAELHSLKNNLHLLCKFSNNSNSCNFVLQLRGLLKFHSRPLDYRPDNKEKVG
jgi:hypothetical protein